MNEQEFRETLKDFGQLVRPVPDMADLALRQAQQRGRVRRAAVVGGTAFAVAGVFGAVAALPVLERGFAPADGGGGTEPVTTPTPSMSPEPVPTPTPSMGPTEMPTPTPSMGPTEMPTPGPTPPIPQPTPTPSLLPPTPTPQPR